LKFYSDEADKLAAKIDARKNSPIVGSTVAAGSGTGGAGQRSAESLDALRGIARQVEDAQHRASLDIAHIGRDFTRTSEEKRRLMRSMLQAETNSIYAAQLELEAVIEALTELDPSASNRELAAAV